MDGKGEKRGGKTTGESEKKGICRARYAKDKAGWPRIKALELRGKHNGRETEGKAPRGRPRDKYLGKVKKDTGKKSHREVKELAWDKKEWRASVYQS
jgi:hypothetical protein